MTSELREAQAVLGALTRKVERVDADRQGAIQEMTMAATITRKIASTVVRQQRERYDAPSS